MGAHKYAGVYMLYVWCTVVTFVAIAVISFLGILSVLGVSAWVDARETARIAEQEKAYGLSDDYPT